MPFRYIGRPTPILREVLVTNGTAISSGGCLVFAAGRVSPATANAAVAAVATHAVLAGTDRRLRVIIVQSGQEWEADYVGTPAGGFVVGVTTAALNAGGDSLNAADVAAGPCSVLGINSAARRAVVMFRNRALT